MSASILINDEGREVRIDCDDDSPWINIRVSTGEEDGFFWASETVSLRLSPANLDALEAAIAAARARLAEEATS